MKKMQTFFISAVVSRMEEEVELLKTSHFYEKFMQILFYF